MSKPKKERSLADTEAKAIGRSVRTSQYKLNRVVESIRGKRVEQALAELTFSPKRIAGEVIKVLRSAIANAENNHNLDVDALVVAEASVGKSITMKRFHTRGRGKSTRILKPFSRLRIVVREVEEA
jgi:large subunit ribosomal protein L22